jgi:hypothetical protein
MRVVVLTRNDTDYARAIEMFVTDFARQTGKALEVLDIDSPEAESLARTYDIVQYPTIIAVSDDGQMQNMWSGTTLPTISEVSYYVQ